MKICFTPRHFQHKSQQMLRIAQEIIDEFEADGYILTLRQLYYQFVARDLIENSQRAYSRLGALISSGRLSGNVSWAAIEDRTRRAATQPNWDSPGDIIKSAAYGFNLDRWEGQDTRVEIWVEKEALAGVFSRVAQELGVTLLSCRGYLSASAMYSAAERAWNANQEHMNFQILHFGDHDPSGMDMTRDIQDRMELFCSGSGVYVNNPRSTGFTPDAVCRVDRVALNMDQIREYNPPPNPAKLTDTRSHGYIQEYGKSSWELDALEPRVLADLAKARVQACISDPGLFADREAEQAEGRELLRAAARDWDNIALKLRPTLGQ